MARDAAASFGAGAMRNGALTTDAMIFFGVLTLIGLWAAVAMSLAFARWVKRERHEGRAGPLKVYALPALVAAAAAVLLVLGGIGMLVRSVLGALILIGVYAVVIGVMAAILALVAALGENIQHSADAYRARLAAGTDHPLPRPEPLAPFHRRFWSLFKTAFKDMPYSL